MIYDLLTLWFLWRLRAAIGLLMVVGIALVICADKHEPARQPVHRKVAHRHER